MAKAPKTPAPDTIKPTTASKPAGKKAPKAAAAPPVAPAAAPAATLAVAGPARADVARRAYELWLAHGGTAHDNWLEAERQLRG